VAISARGTDLKVGATAIGLQCAP